MRETHVLKCWTHFFSALWDGDKNFEIRRNDRNFQAGDKVILQERYSTGEYSNRVIFCSISYVTNFEQKSNYVVMALKDTVRHTKGD